MDIEFARKLVPEFAALVDAAFQTDTRGETAEDSLNALDAEVDKLKSEGLLVSQAIQEIGDPLVREKFEKGFSVAKKVAAIAGLEAPDAEDFEHQGANFKSLAAYVTENPDFVPIVAPNGWGIKLWEQVFKHVARETFTNGQLDPNKPLEVGREVFHEFTLLDRAANASIDGTKNTVVHDPKTKTVWTIRLVPAAQKPNKMGLNHSAGPHVTLPEMLMLQLTHLFDGLDLVDKNTFTWLSGLLADEKLAARHVYDASQKQIIITSREKGNQGPHLGARTPVCDN